MKQTLTFSQFHDAFRDMDRLDNFSYEGLRVLFDWFESLDDDCGTDTELDVIAICCEFSESDHDNLIPDYGIDVSECEDEDEEHEAILEHLNYNTIVCGETSDTIIYADF